MSYSSEALEFGRKTSSICQIELSDCSLTFGVSPCTATGEECYNTRSTCKDTANFAGATVTHTFIQENQLVPIGELMHPCLISANIAPNRVTFGQGLGYRGKCTVLLRDFKHDDIGIDPYQSSRSYDTEQGTFFGKLIARNKYYIGRKIKVMTGYSGAGPIQVVKDGVPVVKDGAQVVHGTADGFSLFNYETREYLIENIEGPDSKGIVKITGIDTLKKIDNERAQCPAPSEGSLFADITDSDTTATLTPSGIGSEYAASGLIRIGDEIMDFTRSSDVLTIVRGQYGTTAESHSEDDTVQECKVFDDNFVDILYELCKDYADIPVSYLPYNDNPSDPDEWDDEKAAWFSDVNHHTIVSKPTGVGTLIDELTYQSMCLMWADALTQKVKIKAIAPSPPTDTVPAFYDNTQIVGGSMKITKNDSERLTQMWVSYSPYDWSQLKDEDDYAQTLITAALTEEGEDLYGDKRVKNIMSRWFTSETRVSGFSSALVNYAKDTPVELSFSVDAADKIEVGIYIDIATRTDQDNTGAIPLKRYYVIESKETSTAHRFALKVRTSFFDDLNFGYFAPDDAVDYSTDSDEYKELYGYFADDNGLNPDGTDGYLFV